MDTYQLSRLLEGRPTGQRYVEFLRVPALSAGVYVLRAGESDPQRPHREDEIYYVTSGRGVMRVGSEDRPVEAGTIVYVPPGVDHRFHSIAEELRVLVVFAPAESSPV